MDFPQILGFVCAAILIYKFAVCMNRNPLSQLDKIKFGFSAGLIVAFIVITKILPFPESLYWFVFITILALSVLLSLKVVRLELKRFWTLSRKDRVINILYYPLLIAVLFITF